MLVLANIGVVVLRRGLGVGSLLVLLPMVKIELFLAKMANHMFLLVSIYQANSLSGCSGTHISPHYKWCAFILHQAILLLPAICGPPKHSAGKSCSCCR